MKKIWAGILTLSLVFQLSGCCLPLDAIKKINKPIEKEQLSTQPATEATVEATEPTEAPTTVPPTEAPTEAPTEPLVEPMSIVSLKTVKYLKKVPAEGCIFTQPDPNSDFVDVVGTDGTFTIVEEATLSNGDVWGKLKSGMGWVNMTDPYCGGAQVPPVTASYSGKVVLKGDYHLAGICTDDEYKVNVTLFAHETVYDLEITDINYDTMMPTDALYHLDELTPEKPLVAHLSFPGDMSSFGLRFRDSAGGSHEYLIWQGMNDGAPIVLGTPGY